MKVTRAHYQTYSLFCLPFLSRFIPSYDFKCHPYKPFSNLYLQPDILPDTRLTDPTTYSTFLLDSNSMYLKPKCLLSPFPNLHFPVFPVLTGHLQVVQAKNFSITHQLFISCPASNPSIINPINPTFKIHLEPNFL